MYLLNFCNDISKQFSPPPLKKKNFSTCIYNNIVIECAFHHVQRKILDASLGFAAGVRSGCLSVSFPGSPLLDEAG